jgi:transposase
MQVVHSRCCGLDVHKKSVVACVLITAPDGTVQRTVRTFATMTADLLALDDWLRQLEVVTVGLESTGIYWRPVYQLLEAGRTMILANPRHMKAVPGRKTDVKDSEWIADLLRHGLLHARCIPPKSAHPRVTRIDPLPHQLGARRRRRNQPGPEGAGNCEHQVGHGGQ